jgi:hypothetical protein
LNIGAVIPYDFARSTGLQVSIVINATHSNLPAVSVPVEAHEDGFKSKSSTDDARLLDCHKATCVATFTECFQVNISDAVDVEA